MHFCPVELLALASALPAVTWAIWWVRCQVIQRKKAPPQP